MKNVNDKIKVYLITGVAGFIGANLAKRILNLQNEKIHIIGIDNLNDYYDVKLKEYRLSELQKFDEFEFIKCDISNKEKIGQIFEKYKPDIVVNLAAQAGVRKVYLIEEPIAAAIGAGLDISKPCGNMVIDIGGGTTDIAVISLGGSVVSTSIKVAGDKFDEAIVRYIKKKYNTIIGERTAEDLKINIGCVYPKIQDMEMDIRGRDLATGLPKTITVRSSEMLEALIEPAMQVVDAVHSVLEKTPPELAADISDRGVYMTGGGCLIDGLDKLLQEKTGINVMIAQDAVSCVALGTGKALDNLDALDGKRRK